MESYLVQLLGVALVGFCLGSGMMVALFWLRRVKRTHRMESQLQETEDKCARMLEEAKLAIKDDQVQMQERFEQESTELRLKMKDQEADLDIRETHLSKKLELLGKREKFITRIEKDLKKNQEAFDIKEHKLSVMIEEETENLRRISDLTQEEARELLLKRLESDVEAEAAEMIAKAYERTKKVVKEQSREVVALAIQRYASEHTAENVVASIDLPSDEMKGRIIGREGRNIRAFENATGVDVIVDETPGVVVVSCFDSVRREVGRKAMEKLITDGRIHPTRIEDVAANTWKEIEEMIKQAGQQVAFDLDIHDLHQRQVQMLGRLQFRSSQGQKVLTHSVEVANLMRLMAGEMDLDVILAKRIGLLHDLGKAADHEMEGSHAAIGADMAGRYNESKLIVNAIAAHHREVEPTSIYAVLLQAANAISLSRPGSRQDSIERYIKRMERMESLVNEFDGVDKVYAVNAGREVRIIVHRDKINDRQAIKLCRDIATEVEKEMNYHGEIKISLIRETRIIEYAR